MIINLWGKMYQYSFKPHTADIRLQIKASSRKEIFIGALEGMIDLMNAKEQTGNRDKSMSFKINSSDDVTLLIDFLNEILARICIDKVLYHVKEIGIKPDNSVEVIICGSPLKKFQKEIKAATFHEAYFRETREGVWEAMVIFDI